MAPTPSTTYTLHPAADTATPAPDPAVACGHCRHLVPISRTTITSDGTRVCHTCLQAWYWICPACSSWTLGSSVCGNGCHPDNCDCPDCGPSECYDAGCEDECGGLVHSYTYKPPPVCRGRGPLFLGVELEVATPPGRWEQCAELALSQLAGLGYLKRDSSIGCGFELVTHPMSYPWAIANFPWELLPQLACAGCTTIPAETGLHVHVSRAGFVSPAHAYRWMMLIHRNQAPVTALARRCSPQWAAFTDDDRRAAKDHAKGAPGGFRFRAINTCNRDTFELRVFAASLDVGTVQAALAFSTATVEYTRALTVPDVLADGWTWPRFTAWAAQRPAYQALTDQLHRQHNPAGTAGTDSAADDGAGDR